MPKKITIGINASNIRSGGGVTHLTEILAALEPKDFSIKRVIVWGYRYLLDKCPQRPWLDKVFCEELEGPFWRRYGWQKYRLEKLARDCDVLFVPGGVYSGKFRPYVTMAQNLLPFMPQERRRYGLSIMFLRLVLLKYLQKNTFRFAKRIIFPSKSAQQIILTGQDRDTHSSIVHHGMAQNFYSLPRPNRVVTQERPFRFLYVSIIDVYKHQWHVAEAVAKLRQKGLPVVLDLVGPVNDRAKIRLDAALFHLDPDSKFLFHHGAVPHEKLYRWYQRADGFVYASSCESFGLTLLEAMAAGLPVACSDRTAMPEILGDAGLYFDPEDPESIARVLEELVTNAKLRAQKAKQAFERAKTFSWEKCARETFKFIVKVLDQEMISSKAGKKV
ncbi:glycosyltransferase family 4 protein [candidate division KSB1 bacterium]|nr:glycosyltransferase family 4 protein [candidate division KSB1 bacterium]